MKPRRRQRVVACSPDADTPQHWLLAREIGGDDASDVWPFATRQRRHGLLICGLLIVAVVAPAGLVAWPEAFGLRVAGVQLLWPVLCGAVPVAILVLGVLATRTAERRERRFVAADMRGQGRQGSRNTTTQF